MLTRHLVFAITVIREGEMPRDTNREKENENEYGYEQNPNMIIKSVAFEAARGLMADISDAHPWTNTSGLCENS